MSKQREHLYEFGPFRVNVTERVLLKEERVLPLRAKVFDMLLLLIENGGHLVEKEVLMRQVWPDTFVEESSLAQSISILRKVLGEGGSGQQYIQTVPKRGYRFVAEIRKIYPDGQERRPAVEDEPAPQRPDAVSAPLKPADGEAQAAESKTAEIARGAGGRLTLPRAARGRKIYALLTGLLLLAVLAGGWWYWRVAAQRANRVAPKSIAVLPFKTLGVENKEGMLGLGMADALILKLSRLNQPMILPTSTVAKYTNSTKDTLDIGRELGVEAILDGTVQRADDNVRVTARLIRLSDGQTLWSGVFREQFRDIFTVQDSISEQLSTALALQIAVNDRERYAKRLTQNTEAYQAYLLGLYFWNQSGKEGITKAISHFEQAVEMDSEFAMAHTYLGDSYYFNVGGKYEIIPEDEALKRARYHLAKALSLDQTIPEAHTALAGIKNLEKDYAGAEIEYKRAIDLNPNLAMAHNRYGVFLFNQSDLDGALRELRRARDLDPASRVYNVALANMLLFSRQYDESLKYSRQSLEIDPNYFSGMLILGEGYLLKGMHDEAIARFEELNRTNSKHPIQLGRIDLIIAYASAGRKAEADRLLREMLQSGEPFAPYSIATAYAALGDKDRAFEWLKKEQLTPFRKATLKFDPFLDPLRSDPRFTELLLKPPQDD